MKTLKLTGPVLALLLSGAASAEFVSTDWKVEGDGKATLDTYSGLEWLKLNETKASQYTIPSMGNYTQAGAVFDGWRLPTRDEVVNYLDRMVDFSRAQSWNDANTQLTITEPYTDQLVGAAVDHLGVASSYSSNRQSKGVFRYIHPTLGERVTAMEINDNHYAYNDSMVFGGTGSRNMAYKPTNSGVFLVSDGGTTLTSINNPSINRAASDVHAPVAFGAALLVMMGAVRLRRGNKRTHI